MRGPADQPRWVRPALLVLLAGTAVLYLWDLSASGYANEYYAAAVQAGTRSLKAWLFGSLDSGNAIAVDKPPAALWVMTASARLFGFSSWSLLVPQALMGVAAVGLLYAAVRRWAGPVAGLLAGTVLALTPAAVLMFRFDNPDALLTLLLIAGAYLVVRAVDAASVRASTWWLVAAGAVVGFGFLAKMGQALLVVPAFGLVYLVAGPTRFRTRILQLGAALVAMVVAAGWYIALVELWPAADRPYIGGSTTNLALAAAATVAWGFVLLMGSGEGFAWVRWVVLGAGVVAVGGLLATGWRRAVVAGIAAAVLTGLAAPSAYAVSTAATAHGGSIPSVGTSASAMGGPGGTAPRQAGATDGARAVGGGNPPGRGMPGGMGGATSVELTALLRATTSTWSAAVSSSQSASSLELASGTAVMSTGGWSGSDTAVTLAQFQADVAQGRIHYYVGGGQGGGPGGGSDSTSAQIAAWVRANFTATTVGGQTVYDLTA